jgi:flagellar M-ring protein FliF
MKRFWDFLARQVGTTARMGLVAGAVAIVLLTVAAGFWLLRTDYQVLFAGLSPQDTAAMTAELDRLKVPYVLSDKGEAPGSNTVAILVDRNDVYKTRIKLMGKDIPLHGAVGFELFNNSDLGMTEFAQKINYQRALQGELTRTILSLDEIRDARVLLALPEQGLFKQAANKPKASVTLVMKQGRSLRSEQVAGLQRLVSAAVPGIAAQDVTIVDQSGVALTRASGDGSADADAGSSAARLDLKKDTESYLSRKATLVLERALGEGQASASVDVTLNMDRVQSNTDELIGAPGKPGSAPTGVITRERDTTREMAAPLGPTGTGGAAGSSGGSNQREVEYALGHRVEQVVSQPGSIRRIQVAVVVRSALSPEQQEQLRRMVAAAVGASSDRGDAVVVQTVAGFGSSGRRGGNSPSVGESASIESGTSDESDRSSEGRGALNPALASWRAALAWGASHTGLGLLGAMVLVVLLGGLAWGSRRNLQDQSSAPSLSDLEREELLSKVRHWMQEPR